MSQLSFVYVFDMARESAGGCAIPPFITSMILKIGWQSSAG